MFRALMALRRGRRMGQAGHDGIVHRPRNSLMGAIAQASLGSCEFPS